MRAMNFKVICAIIIIKEISDSDKKPHKILGFLPELLANFEYYNSLYRIAFVGLKNYGNDNSGPGKDLKACSPVAYAGIHLFTAEQNFLND